jgi:hypothetical protein
MSVSSIWLEREKMLGLPFLCLDFTVAFPQLVSILLELLGVNKTFLGIRREENPSIAQDCHPEPPLGILKDQGM